MIYWWSAQLINFITATINPAEEAELDRILAGVDYTKCDEVSEQLGPSLQLNGPVMTPTMNAVSVKGMALIRGGSGQCESKVVLARGLLFLFHSDFQNGDKE